MSNVKNFYFIFLFFLFTLASSNSLAKDGDALGINIPVRLGISAGYHQGSVSFNSDKKDIANNNFLLGFDFNVPIPPIKSLIGISLWFVPSAKTGTTTLTSSLFAGPYVGLTKGKNDFLIGLGVSGVSTTIKDQDAAPDSEINLNKTMGCGFIGWRNYFNKSQSTGLGLMGYTCLASDYTKTLNSQNDTKTTISDKASASGGFFYLFFAWGEERKII